MRRQLEGVSCWLSSVAVAAFALWLCAACQPRQTSAATGTSPQGSTGSRQSLQEGELRGIDSSELTARERREWWTLVSELLAPCPDQPVSIAVCVHEERACAACSPAAEFLMTQVKLGKTRSQIETAFGLRFDPTSVEALELDDAPSKGADDATVTIVEWADFQCPFCAVAAPYLEYLTEAYPGHVRVVFKHFPISYHEQAVPAARAAIAAQRQGKFWEMHDALYANRRDLSIPVLERLAEEIGLDMERFEADMQAQSTQDIIDRDRRQADELGLRGTPMIYVNGRYFDLEHFDMMVDMRPWVELEIEKATGKRPKPEVPPPARVRGPAGASPIGGAGH